MFLTNSIALVVNGNIVVHVHEFGTAFTLCGMDSTAFEKVKNPEGITVRCASCFSIDIARREQSRRSWVL
jgi:hypothetical protein